MIAAFYFAGFDSIDIHMSDLLNKRIDLSDFKGLATCGGFSFGDECTRRLVVAGHNRF
ncbi:phosphoribosylformylglycinamidine synthase subunit PurQ [Coxiella-like endosymbiont of Rhipicephalus sanguineus]|uniref:phosphoribosylformylglycinamidine synthase subunit PurQ n=1 Tax=Coxiella-like endosymbiont of Rhipicephalus sanguineus TaxID=1955402 RepID=UPI00203D2B1E|nr:phosphoribosylformylglycinamidine synthase subunit PurQ [Coxiella-like endosymbiont of Rhipicephalus sanguineus]